MNYESHRKISRSGFRHRLLAAEGTEIYGERERGDERHRHIDASHDPSVYVFKTLIVPAEVEFLIELQSGDRYTWPAKHNSNEEIKKNQSKDSIQPNKEINHSPKKYVCCFLLVVYAWLNACARAAHIPILCGRHSISRVRVVAKLFACAVIISFSIEMRSVSFLLHCIDGFDFPCNFIRRSENWRFRKLMLFRSKFVGLFDWSSSE